ncbi:hypothetical protein Tco_1308569, partial [Tanacetum coccineum]
MCTYLKNIEGYKLQYLKLKGFDSIQEIFDRAFKRLIEIILDEEEVTIDAIPLAVKSPSIVDWKIHKEGRKSYYQIIRADGKSQMYMIFSHMLKSFDRKYLETLYKLVKAKYESTRPVEDLDLVLWNDLKTMFEPHVEDNIWRNQQDYKVLSWKLYDSYRVHFLRMQHMQIYMLVEKKYPLTPSTLSMMLKKKLMNDYETEVSAAHGIQRKYAKCLLLLVHIYVPQWSMTNGSRLDDDRICREMVDEFAPPNFFMSVRGMEHDQLFTEFNVRAAHQMSLSAEVRMRAEYNVKEKRRLKSVVERQ